MRRGFNRNETVTTDSRYVRQQQAIREVCAKLGLVAYYPDYHADKTDNNTVIIYTKEGDAYNRHLPSNASVDDEKGRVCVIENTDVNGRFDLDWINRGRLCMRGLNEKEQIEEFIKNCLAKHQG